MIRLRDFVAGYRGFERDARIFLVGTLFAYGAIGLFWINFNLYLASLGFDAATIGLIATAGTLSSAAVSLPASILSDRFGRRRSMIGGSALAALALLGLLLTNSLAAIFVLAVVYNVAQQVRVVVQNPFMTEHSTPMQRNELFSLQWALLNATQVVTALAGGALAAAIAASGGHGLSSPDAYRVLLALMVILTLGALLTAIWLRDDRPAHRVASTGGAERAHGRLESLGVRIGNPGLFTRLLLPGFIISIGAGQVLPFLNLYLVGRFGLDLLQTNLVFAVTGFGTMLAILVQPILARRFGRIGSVVRVQAASIGFLFVLGFAPIVWLVVISMAVRNSLMNASNPIYDAFVMDKVRPVERATVAASEVLFWSFGLAIGGVYYSFVQATLGFERGYNVNFITIIVLYSVATSMYWFWFGRAERAERASQATPRYDQPPLEAPR